MNTKNLCRLCEGDIKYAFQRKYWISTSLIILSVVNAGLYKPKSRIGLMKLIKVTIFPN